MKTTALIAGTLTCIMALLTGCHGPGHHSDHPVADTVDEAVEELHTLGHDRPPGHAKKH